MLCPCGDILGVVWELGLPQNCAGHIYVGICWGLWPHIKVLYSHAKSGALSTRNLI